jgi:hypothetical protein
MKVRDQGNIEISVGDTPEEETQTARTTSVHGSVCGEIRRALLAGEELTDAWRAEKD